MVCLNKVVRERYMRFARSTDALWAGNFRDLPASVTLMPTLANAGGIDAAIVDSEVARLKRLWQY